MKKELNRKIISICEKSGSALAAEKCGQYMDDVDREYDKKVSDGMTELDAYRAMLDRIAEIQAEVDRLKSSEEENEAQADSGSAGRLRNILGQVTGFVWIADVIIIIAGVIFNGLHTLPYTLATLPLAAAATVISMAVADANDPSKDYKGFTGGKIALIAVFAALSAMMLLLWRARRLIVPVIVIIFLVSLFSKSGKAK